MNCSSNEKLLKKAIIEEILIADEVKNCQHQDLEHIRQDSQIKKILICFAWILSGRTCMINIENFIDIYIKRIIVISDLYYAL